MEALSETQENRQLAPQGAKLTRIVLPRRSPRPIIDRRALVRPQSGRVIAARAHDISLGGVQLRCDEATAYALHFNGKKVDRRHSPTFELRLSLPFDQTLIEFGASCRLFYVVPSDSRELAVGLGFEHLDPDAFEVLDSFLYDVYAREASLYLGSLATAGA